MGFKNILIKFWIILKIIFKDYCLNSSLAGVGYIAAEKYHYTERIFWLICLTLSAYGSYHLIKEYQVSFEGNAISMVLQEVNINEEIQFPSVGICELGDTKSQYINLEKIVESLKTNESSEYNNDVEDFLLRIIFQNTYSSASLNPSCEPYFNCDDNCIKCPTKDYQNYAKNVRATCEKLFEKCVWKGKSFNCCKYFLPLQTSMGECFLLNSIQVTEKNGPHWFNMNVSFEIGNGELEIILTKAIAIHILNEEDIPHMILTTLQFIQTNPGYQGKIALNLQNVVNDPSVHDVRPDYRKCVFPEEHSDKNVYKYYSFSVCVTECLRRVQLDKCNCTNYNLITKKEDEKYICDYDGFICLDNNDIMFPQTTILQPWRTNSLVCSCQPSCNEHEIKVVERTFRIDSSTDKRSIRISLQALPTEHYRRQTVRAQLDVVVSIGGILGLFMGASILSGIELISIFLARIIENVFF